MARIVRYLCCIVFLMSALHASVPLVDAAATGGEAVFEIRAFDIAGNSIFPGDQPQEAVAAFTGMGRTAADVEKARDALEKLYHNAGYPAVLVNIPEQSVEGGIVKLQVIESRIGQVMISGNRYFTMEKIMGDLPSFSPGELLYLPKVQRDIARLNRNRDIKVEPAMSLGNEPGTIDVELKVEDHLPLHGYLELNNKSSHDMSELLANAMIRYDNIWQKEHSLALQYQISPSQMEEVQLMGLSYALPAPWKKDDQVALFGIWSDSDKAFADGLKVVGKGKIFGVRYVLPLPPHKLYAHSAVFGLDYKDFKESLGFAGSPEETNTPVTYMPLSFSYNASLPDAWGGVSRFSGGLNLSFRGVISDQREFAVKRFRGNANYLYATAGVERNQKLPFGMGLFIKVDGQAADQPLIANEQYSAGGMDSVRGYKESEASGDDAVHATVELSFSDPLEKFGIGKSFQGTPYLFYDMAIVEVKEPLLQQDRRVRLEGAGVGLRGSMTKHLEYELAWAMALGTAGRIERNDSRFYFKLKSPF